MRRPVAAANWKTEMTIARSLAFARDFQLAKSNLAKVVDIVICPPHTSLHALSQGNQR